MKHTKGPWAFDGDHILVNGKELLAMLGAVDEENEANGKLISAAPDLLEAAKSALASMVLVSVSGDAEFRRFKETCDKLYKAISKAIDKAEGK